MQNGQNQELQCLPKMQIKAIVHEKKKKKNHIWRCT